MAGTCAALIAYGVLLSIFRYRVDVAVFAALYGGVGGVVFAIADALTTRAPKRRASRKEQEHFLEALEKNRPKGGSP